MTLPTGSRGTNASAELVRAQSPPLWPSKRPQTSAGFTLIELILVMTMLVIVLAVAAPSLSRFFRGRTLDSETKRFLALTRYGQSRAVSEGVPMLLWIDPQQGAYGLQADSSYVEQDTLVREYKVSPDVQVEVEQSPVAKKLATVWKGSPGGLPAKIPKIRFTPDGFIGTSSPELVVFRGRDEAVVGVGENASRLQYEIRTNRFQTLWR